MVGGNSKLEESANRLGLPVDLISDSEAFLDNATSIYPDNATAVYVFDDMLTQWRFGPNGITGLDYNVIPFIFRTRRTPIKDRAEVLECIKVMERSAVTAIRAK